MRFLAVKIRKLQTRKTIMEVFIRLSTHGSLITYKNANFNAKIPSRTIFLSSRIYIIIYIIVVIIYNIYFAFEITVNILFVSVISANA